MRYLKQAAYYTLGVILGEDMGMINHSMVGEISPLKQRWITLKVIVRLYRTRYVREYFAPKGSTRH